MFNVRGMAFFRCLEGLWTDDFLLPPKTRKLPIFEINLVEQVFHGFAMGRNVGIQPSYSAILFGTAVSLVFVSQAEVAREEAHLVWRVRVEQVVYFGEPTFS